MGDKLLFNFGVTLQLWQRSVRLDQCQDGIKVLKLYEYLDDRAFNDACILENLNTQKSTSKSSKVLYNSTNNRPWKIVVYLLDTNSCSLTCTAHSHVTVL